MRFQYGHTVVITGGSSGIGLACAEMFASNGYTVFSLSRHAAKSKVDHGRGVIHTLPCDVCDDASVEAACKKITQTTEEIGIVIHSAGFGIAGAAEDTDIELAKRQMETNYFGVLRVNRQIIPLMRKRGAGLVLIIGSIAGLVSIPFQSHYSASKYALEAYTEALRIEARLYGIRACIIEPGDTRTGFTAARIKEQPLCDTSPYASVCGRSIAKMEKDEQSGKPPDTVARVALLIAGKKNPPVRMAVGIEYKLVLLLRRLLPSRLMSWIVAKIYSSG